MDRVGAQKVARARGGAPEPPSHLEDIVVRRMVEPVSGCRSVGKRDMVRNDATPVIEVDPERYEVRADGQLLTCEPARVLPMAQRYFLF